MNLEVDCTTATGSRHGRVVLSYALLSTSRQIMLSPKQHYTAFEPGEGRVWEALWHEGEGEGKGGDSTRKRKAKETS